MKKELWTLYKKEPSACSFRIHTRMLILVGMYSTESEDSI